MKWTPRLDEAIRKAAILHKDQVRKGGEGLPVLTHLVAVMSMVSDHTNDEDVLIAALLHDSVEDTDYTFEEMEKEFGSHVRDIVEGVTIPFDSLTSNASWVEAREAYIANLERANDASLIVSMADKIYNLSSMCREYRNKKESFSRDFAGKAEERITMYNKLIDVYRKRLPHHPLEREFEDVVEEYKRFLTA